MQYGYFLDLTSNSTNHSGVSFVGCGSATPKQIIGNDQLGQRVDTNNDWIQSRTGISQRRVIGTNESLIDLASEAALSAVNMAKWDVKTIDLIILATSTPEDLFGSAPQIQAKIGATNAVAFDLTAACSGFLFSLVTAAQYLISGSMNRVIVIGADQLSKWVDWDDRKTCVLFGDGAGAVILSADSYEGIISSHIHADGQYNDLLSVEDKNIKMRGNEVFKVAVNTLSKLVDETLNKNNLDKSDIDWLVPHQANLRIIKAAAKKLSMSLDQVVVTVDKHANTSAASIPLALNEAVKDGRIKDDQVILLEAFGSGFTWGSVLLRY